MAKHLNEFERGEKKRKRRCVRGTVSGRNDRRVEGEKLQIMTINHAFTSPCCCPAVKSNYDMLH